MKRALRLAVAAMALPGPAACTTDNDSNVTPLTTPAPATTERFAGTLDINQRGAPPHTPARSLAGAPTPRAAPSQARCARLGPLDGAHNENRMLVRRRRAVQSGASLHGRVSNGLVTVTLTAAGPPETIVLGLAIGTFDGTACTPLANGSRTTAAGATPQLSGTLNGGRYCVQASDVGNQTAPVTYAVTITHF